MQKPSTTPESSAETPLERAYRTAHFLHPEKRTALDVLLRALARLQVALSSQQRRLDYVPRGRRGPEAAAGTFRNRVSFGERELLQQLVFAESEPHERWKERGDEGGSASEEDMIVYFLKHLVRITTRRNSFYVTLGLGRLLHDYTTPEAMALYNAVVQDPGRVKEDDYWRAGKRRLIDELRARFGERLRIRRGARGEERFEPVEHPSRFGPLVGDALRTFMPWEPSCPVPARFDPLHDPLPALTSGAPEQEDELETRRMHAVIHPECWRRLAAALALAPCEERLSLPALSLASDDERPPRDDRRREAPTLLPEDLLALDGGLADDARRRRSAFPHALLVKVDGEIRVRWDLEASPELRLSVEPEASWLDVVALEGAREVPLASCFLSAAGRPGIVLEGGQRIAIEVQAASESEPWQVHLRYDETFALRRVRRAAESSWRRLAVLPAPARSPLWAAAAAVAVVAVSVVLLSPPAPLTPTGGETPSSSRSAGVPAVAAPQLSTPAAPSTPAEREVAPPPRERTRSSDQAASLGSLAQVRVLLLQVQGDDAAELQAALERALESSGRFTLTTDPERADAALKVSVRGTSTPAGGPSRSAIQARCVAPDGRVLWPKVGEAQDRGGIADVSRRLSARLVEAAGR